MMPNGVDFSFFSFFSWIKPNGIHNLLCCFDLLIIYSSFADTASLMLSVMCCLT